MQRPLVTVVDSHRESQTPTGGTDSAVWITAAVRSSMLGLLALETPGSYFKSHSYFKSLTPPPSHTIDLSDLTATSTDLPPSMT